MRLVLENTVLLALSRRFLVFVVAFLGAFCGTQAAINAPVRSGASKHLVTGLGRPRFGT